MDKTQHTPPIQTARHQRLYQQVELLLGQAPQTPKDFDILRKRIYTRLHVLISATTLKRAWGYLASDSEPSIHTLNTLAQFVGYQDYERFRQQADAAFPINSNPVLSRHIDVETDLIENDRLQLSWLPDRICRLRYLGGQQFEVTDSQNTRLQQGDTFRCSLIIEGEPLYLSHLVQQGQPPVNYVCGKHEGIRFERTSE